MALTLNEAKFEHEFWLQVLGDHCRFIFDSLSPSEANAIATSTKLKSEFDRLLAQARSLDDVEKAMNVSKEAGQFVKELKNLKLFLLKRLLYQQIKIHLSPTFLNHMVNELEEYERILSYLVKNESPPVAHELHHHLLWLQDASGHAGAINDQLDGTEKSLKMESAQFNQNFDHLYLKAVELAGYLRTNDFNFPALKRMNKKAKLEIKAFQLFLDEILELDISAQMLGTFPVLMADHMFREECYYLTKLAEATKTTKPNCDPTSPRVES
ncbi:DUF2935 domain-containing protein [Bacillus sp. FJAT-50079]|uniref:DUF2935 domain-containing protein n=1 Tax=Bacillus sp. FJAT-50079 TaxID=2833577 RepID=UPI001BC91292|nr:DUF2935 domain-containing protein [Bacillus sp. FJAT-50079]MBS4209885.1 DUF2935 domain-containing protein [Bacillus sp. FJAT-50079]